MKWLVAVVQPFRAQAVLEAVSAFDIDTVLVCEAKGYGRQKEQIPRYLESEYSRVTLPKVELHLAVADELAGPVAECIRQTAMTGRIGDGKLFVQSVLASFEF